MAKTKHQLLAQEMKKLLGDIDDFAEKLRELKFIQLFFYEKKYIVGRPLIKEKAFSGMVKTYSIGLRIFSPCSEVREACQQYPCIGVPLKLQIYPLTQCLRSSELVGKWIVPWGAKVTLPSQMNKFHEKERLGSLIYCPDKSELSNEIDWFEKDDYINSFSFTLRSAFEITGKENDGKAVIRRNLDQLALPYFSEVVEQWQKDPDGHDTIPKNPAIVFKKSFAPTENDYIAHAYEKVRRVLRDRSLRNYEHLMISWQGFLEKLIFTNVAWDDSEKDKFIKEWELNIFGNPTKCPENHDGRWEQAMATDRSTAGKLLKYFIDRFLADPSKYKKDGEIACILWTLIWLSQDPSAGNITLTCVLDLDTAAVGKEHSELIFDEETIEISMGLHRLLTILRGSGKIKRHLLFEHVSSDYLQYALKEASIALFGSDITPISPTAFLSFPHAMKDSRLPRRQIMRLRSVDTGSEAGYARRQFLKVFREARDKKSSS